MRNLKRLKILKNYGATQLSLVKDLDRAEYFVEKSIIVNIAVQKKLFENEKKVHALFNNRYIIKFIETINTSSFLMEYASNGSLADLLDAQPHPYLNPKQLRQLLTGLSYIHDMGYVHNDIKPSNILIDEDNRLKISDFAFSGKIGHSFFEDFPDYFQLGTERFYSKFKNGEKTNQIGNDIYALGVVLYQAFSSSRDLNNIHLNTVEDENMRYIINGCLNDVYQDVHQIIKELPI